MTFHIARKEVQGSNDEVTSNTDGTKWGTDRADRHGNSVLSFAYIIETQLFCACDHVHIPTAKQRRLSTDLVYCLGWQEQHQNALRDVLR